MSKKLLLLSALLSAVVMFTPSCGSDSDECADVDCGANGACFSGSCVCDDGYEQDADGKCTIESRQDFLGTYSCTETCSPGSQWNSTITTSSQGADRVVVSNFGDSNAALTCTVDGNDITVVPGQTIGGLAVNGSGSINNASSVITFNYSTTQFNCTMTMTKQ
ncbi:MAG: hypothetical protein SFV52_08860 [Saprospiraceae bacterium]|nr:hypothetical protein [Saprospiraceae bacterium]